MLTRPDVNEREEEEGKEGRREGGKEGRREGGKEGMREGGKERRDQGLTLQVKKLSFLYLGVAMSHLGQYDQNRKAPIPNSYCLERLHEASLKATKLRGYLPPVSLPLFPGKAIAKFSKRWR
jgi:hypothetical protein